MFLASFSLLCCISLAQENSQKPVPLTDEEFSSLAQTPPMGWNSFTCSINEKVIMETVDARVSSGMKDAGYEYIVIDDCWQIDRDADGNIVCDPEKFPHGMKYIEDYVHPKGLTLTENITHFSMWCMLAAPLMAGNDIRTMKEEIKDILTNTEAIAVDGWTSPKSMAGPTE